MNKATRQLAPSLPEAPGHPARERGLLRAVVSPEEGRPICVWISTARCAASNAAGVGMFWRPTRSKSAVPQACSARCMALVMAGWLTPAASAASAKLPFSMMS